MTEQPRLPSDVVEARLNHLIDRARRGALLPEEADQFTTELRDLVRRLENEEDTNRRLLAQRQEMAAERHAWQERGDTYRDAWHSARDRARKAKAEVARLTAGQCVDSRRMCDLHHQQPVTGCPYARCLTAREQPTTA